MTLVDNIRLWYDKEILEICPHISTRGRIVPKDREGCEYINKIQIECKECKEIHILVILIN